MFKVSWEEVLARLWFGRYICTVYDLFGGLAVDILSFIMNHGKSLGNATDTTLYHSTLITLLKSMYIKPISVSLQISPRDRLLRYKEDAERAKRACADVKKGPLASRIF